LWAVCELDEDLDDDGYYFSAETTARRDGNDTILTGIALVERTASVGNRPVRVLNGRLDYPEVRRAWKLGELERRIVEQAAITVRSRGRYSRDPIVVHDDAPRVAPRDDDRRPASPLEIRPGSGRILRVY
jgi:hypothetical protein